MLQLHTQAIKKKRGGGEKRGKKGTWKVSFPQRPGLAADTASPFFRSPGKGWQGLQQLDGPARLLNPFNPLYSNRNIGGWSLKTAECGTPAAPELCANKHPVWAWHSRAAQRRPQHPPRVMRLSLPLWPRLPQLEPALVNGPLALWPSPNGSMNHTRPRKNNLPVCQEVERTELILVWKWLKSLTNPPSFYSVARKVDYPGLKPMWMTVLQPRNKKGNYLLSSWLVPLNSETKPMLFTTPLILTEISSHTIRCSSLMEGITYAPYHLCLSSPIAALLQISQWVITLILLQTNFTLKNLYLFKAYRHKLTLSHKMAHYNIFRWKNTLLH